MVEHEAEPEPAEAPPTTPSQELSSSYETPAEEPAPVETPSWDAPAAETTEEPVQALSNSDFSYETPVDPSASAIEPDVAAEAFPAEAPAEETPADDNWTPIGQTEPEEKEPTGFADVTEFANSENPAGTLTYTITIRGLELAETFERLREALTDSRFAWDADAIMGEVRNGEVTLARVNPAKTSILVSRLKYLALEISWRQDVFA